MQRTTLGVSPHRPPWRRVRLPGQLAWELPGFRTSLHCWSAGITGTHHCLGLCGSWGSEPWSSHLHNKHFPSWSHLPGHVSVALSAERSHVCPSSSYYLLRKRGEANMERNLHNSVQHRHKRGQDFFRIPPPPAPHTPYRTHTLKDKQNTGLGSHQQMSSE